MFKKKSSKCADKTSDMVDTNPPTDLNRPDRLIPMTKWSDFHPWPSLAGLRHIRFFAKEKGATDCFVKSGGRVLVREQIFFAWALFNNAT